MKTNTSATRASNRYAALIEKIFFDLYKRGLTSLEFEREELKRAATTLKIQLPENLGDVIYSMRFRTQMPASVLKTQAAGSEWIIELAGRSKYRFRLVKKNRIVPNPALATIKIPDSTPEIIAAYALDDEQALLAKVRYNRLLDVFLGITTSSLQNHLRTTVRSIGQIEIDELYVGIDKFGAHYAIPVQAKGGSDQISVVQTRQDMAWCQGKFPHLRCRPISVQFLASDRIAIFELTVEDDEVRVVEERHYKLVPAGELDRTEISTYR
ncbi:MAG TPA: hypothetical protein VF522_21660 [Ramlibacter sp.]|uniref:hypothetical protein n=1 Tax=Ramlibacter sp. TaxID=1917967 RepID=UPI002ED1ABA5